MIDKIVVRRSAHEAADDSQIVQAVVDFVNAMRRDGLFVDDELPANALRSYYTDYYRAQAASIGHGQIDIALQGAPAVYRAIREGLDAIGLEPFVTIYSEFEVFLAERATQSEELRQRREMQLNRFDSARSDETLLPAQGRWLKTLAELRVVADADYDGEIARLCAGNPHRPVRLRLRTRNQLKQDLQQPYAVASLMLSRSAGVNPISVWGPREALHPDGTKQRGYGVTTRTGMGIMFVGAKDVMLCDTYTWDGRRLTREIEAAERIPASEIRKMTRSQLDEKRRQDAARTHRMLFSLPRAKVDDAIASAGRFRVVEAAELAVNRLAGDAAAELRIVFPLDEGWQWAFDVQGGGTAGFLGFIDDEVQVSSASGEKLKFTQADIAAYVAGFGAG